MAKKKFKVTLARLLRQTVTLIVEAESEADIDLKEIYCEHDEENWEDDISWGCEPGTHTVVGEVDA